MITVLSEIIEGSGKEGIKDGGVANGLLRDARFCERYSLAGARSYTIAWGELLVYVMA